MLMEVVLATRNMGKFEELSNLLKVDNIKYVPVSRFNIEDPEETGTTFVENAILKAQFACKNTNLPAIADDSGLEIFSLNGFPGIYSARCAGENATDVEKINFILHQMRDVKDRRARFVSVVAFSHPDNIGFPIFFIGYCEGFITHNPYGIAKPGLQYDSIFYHPPLGKTLAEVSLEVKNGVSHRFYSSNSMKDYLRRLTCVE